jgi:hypothetical protein
MRRNLAVASIVAFLATLVTYSYKTGPHFLSDTRADWLYGFPLPFYKEIVIDAFGVVNQFSILDAVADFLVFFVASLAIMIAITRVRSPL